MCGDWNLNFMVENIRIQEINNFFPNKHSQFTNKNYPHICIPDVVLINKQYSKSEISVVEMGFSDHLAQVIIKEKYTGSGEAPNKQK
jgi:hypothetical protein